MFEVANLNQSENNRFWLFFLTRFGTFVQQMSDTLGVFFARMSVAKKTNQNLTVNSQAPLTLEPCEASCVQNPPGGDQEQNHRSSVQPSVRFCVPPQDVKPMLPLRFVLPKAYFNPTGNRRVPPIVELPQPFSKLVPNAMLRRTSSFESDFAALFLTNGHLKFSSVYARYFSAHEKLRVPVCSGIFLVEARGIAVHADSVPQPIPVSLWCQTRLRHRMDGETFLYRRNYAIRGLVPLFSGEDCSVCVVCVLHFPGKHRQLSVWFHLQSRRNMTIFRTTLYLWITGKSTEHTTAKPWKSGCVKQTKRKIKWWKSCRFVESQ